MGFLGIRFEVWGRGGGGEWGEVGERGGVKLPRLKFVRIMLETSNLPCKHVSRHTYVVSENIPFSTKAS